MNPVIGRVRAALLAILTSVAVLTMGCSAADSSTSEGRSDPPPLAGGDGAAESVAKATGALSATAWGFLRTPAARNANAYQTINCMDCTRSSSGMTPQWATVGTGLYAVKFPGAGPLATSMYVAHVTPFGSQATECTIAGVTVPTGSNDIVFGVACTNSLGNDTDTRFLLTYAAAGNSSAPTQDLAMVGVRNNVLNGTYVSSGPGPTLTKVTTGQYTISLPGLRQAGKRGNAQVTSFTKGVRCNLIAWDVSTTTGVAVHVNCATTFNTPIDAAFNISYTKGSLIPGDPYGYVWMQDASNFDKQFPAPIWNKSHMDPFFGNPDLLSSGMEVKRIGTGRYRVDFRNQFNVRLGQQLELSTVGDGSGSCTVTNGDVEWAEIQCVKNGAPSNSQFSLRAALTDRNTNQVWNLVSGINLMQNYGAGFGMVCGQVAIELKQVQCGVAAGPAAMNMRITGPTLWPDNVRYVAVDNRDLTSTRVLVLGTDRVLRAVSGTMTKSWPAADNFATVSVVAQPTFNPGGARLSLAKIVVVHDSSSNTVIGLTEDSRIVQLSGSQWVASSYPIPSNLTWATISGDVGSLNLLATNGRMFWSVRGQSSAIELPALPNSLKAIGFGGYYAITNANANASGFVPCVAPKNAQGFYDCGSNSRRFQKYSEYTRGWIDVFGSQNVPLSNGDDVLTNGNPVTRPPAIEDARLVYGDVGKSLYAFHYNARLYYFAATN